MSKPAGGFTLSALLVLQLVACGGIDPSAEAPAASGGATAGGTASGGGPAAGAPSLEPLLPWAEGNTWTYRVTQAGVQSTKVTTVGAVEPVGGTGPNRGLMAHRTRTTKGQGGSDETVSWQVVDGDRVIRYREQSFSATSGNLALEEHWEPHKIHIDGAVDRVAPNASWLEAYVETKLPVGGALSTSNVQDRWRVVVDAEMVSVPAGQFVAVVFEKSNATTSKRYWYARGIGKVREEGTQTEELVSYSLAR
jgi:hypothetical protein